MTKKAPGKAHREGLTIVQLMDMFPIEEAATEWFESVIWPRPLPLTDYSTSALFRVIEKYHPTLLLDEIDLKGSNKADDNGELSALLNGSQSRETAYILRSMPSQTGNKGDWEECL